MSSYRFNICINKMCCYLLSQDDNDEAADEDADTEGELTSADYRKLQSLVDEQEKAVEAGEAVAQVTSCMMDSCHHSCKNNLCIGYICTVPCS